MHIGTALLLSKHPYDRPTNLLTEFLITAATGTLTCFPDPGYDNGICVEIVLDIYLLLCLYFVDQLNHSDNSNFAAAQVANMLVKLVLIDGWGILFGLPPPPGPVTSNNLISK